MTSRAELGRTAADAFRSIDRSGNGFLEPGEIMSLLRSLDPARSWTKNDVLFVLKTVDTTRDGRISLKEFKKWWEMHKVGFNGAALNKLLVKDMVGSVRTSTYKLPPQEYRYGMKVPSDMHGAKEILGEWVAEDKRRPASKGAGGKDHAASIHGHKNRPSTPISELIRFDFAGEAGKAKDKAYPETKRRAAAKIPPRETAATMGRVTAVREKQSADAKGTWKMKKFTHARSRISTQPGKVSIPGKSTGIYAGLQGGGSQGRSRVAQAGRVISGKSEYAVIHSEGKDPAPAPAKRDYYDRLPEGAVVTELPPGAHVVDA